MVTIEAENPYDIFDSLNSTGLPLEQSDLIRNFVFMCVPMTEQQVFNDKQWQPFESMFEDQPAASPTLFYRDYLMRRTRLRQRPDVRRFQRRHSKTGRSRQPSWSLSFVLTWYELMIRNPATCSDPVIGDVLNRLAQ